jgi:hypothetical protein
MKLRTLAVAAGVGAPLIVPGAADAGFVGLSVVAKPNGFGLTVCNVYAEFDNPGHDWMMNMAGSPSTAMHIDVVGGEFYNHPFGGETAPPEAWLEVFPSLAYDSFFTIGLKSVAPGGEDALNLVNMPPLAGSSMACARPDRTCAVGLVPPTAAQGNPFDPVHSFPGNGQILIGQYAMETPEGLESWGFEGQFLMQYVADGHVDQSVESFSLIVHAECADDADCDDGDPCNGEEICVDFACVSVPPDPDCNGNGVLDACDIADGTSTDANGNGIPDDCDVMCQADLNFDGRVSATDFLELLAQWGTCP